MTERAKGQQFGQTASSFGVSLFTLGHYLAPLPHHVRLLICHSARGSPAHPSRGPAVTVLMPKITSANGREAEGTDQQELSMTLLASCKLTYCLCPVRPDCPELFLTTSLALSQTEKAKHYFQILVLVYQSKSGITIKSEVRKASVKVLQLF